MKYFQHWLLFNFLMPRFAKKKLDMRSFYGGILHVCYAPEYETIDDTREKLNERRRLVARKCKGTIACSSCNFVLLFLFPFLHLCCVLWFCLPRSQKIMAVCVQGDHLIVLQHQVWLYMLMRELYCLLQMLQVKTSFCPCPCTFAVCCFNYYLF